ncbi:ATP-binding protein [Betaproteobacteria bacterium]|nr:ATP-binding protein [Betaproteobacteria bacterium]
MQIWTGVGVLTSTIAMLFASTSLFLSSLTILYWLFYGGFLLLDLYNNSLAFYIYLPCVMSLIVIFDSGNKITLALTRFFLLGLISQLVFAFQQNYNTKTGIFVVVGLAAAFIFLFNQSKKQIKLKNTELATIRLRNLLKKIHEEKKEILIERKIASNFLASFVHDLRQPIHAINLYISSMERILIKQELETIHSSRLGYSLRRLKMSIRYMNNILDGLLEATKLDQGITTPKIQTINLTNFSKKIINQYSEDASELGLKLSFKSKISKALYISTDPRLLERVLRNLISNSLKFTDEGGVRLRLNSSSNSIILSVIDTGRGIPNKLQKIIFEEFSQIPSKSEIAENTGLGLGLSIAKRLTSKIGGELVIRSTENLGSIFSIRLPANYTKPHQLRSTELEQALEQTIIPQITLTDPLTTIVLLIDEDRSSRDAFNTLEPELSLRIVSGSNSQNILESYKNLSTPPRLIIVNSSNQKEKPLDSIDRLRFEFNKDFPVIFLSSDVERDSMLYRGMKNSEFIQKPVSINGIQNMISKLFEIKM